MSEPTIKSYAFDDTGIATLEVEGKEANWPVVYQIYDDASLYVGETTNLKNRMQQHIKNTEKNSLSKFSVVFSEKYNKSVALDLESQLIQWFSGDGRYTMLNKNDGIADRDYYDRSTYQSEFPIIWEQLRRLGVAEKTITQIENSGLFKFSPYKRLSESQFEVATEILMDLDDGFTNDKDTISIIGGNEGTGKTIVIMYLIKLIRDLQDYKPLIDDEVAERDFELFYQEPFNNRFKNKSIALVVPSTSLKGSIVKIFKGISNMQNTVEVLSPIEFGRNGKYYDITFVDEAHLLKASNQEVHKANRQRVDEINQSLFGDNLTHTELDWIIKKTKHVVMVFGDQRVRPNNILKSDINKYAAREHLLRSQMRSKGGELYIDYLRAILSSNPPQDKQVFNNFDFKLYGSFPKFVSAIRQKDSDPSVGLSKIVAGFAWDWKSNRDKSTYDIEIDGIKLRWNSTSIDWVGSPKSAEEVGSIYTIQGYDLKYCGVIIGNDIKYDPISRTIVIDRKSYFDRGAKKRTKLQIKSNIKLTDDELLDQITRVYRILMNRSTDGTYIYVCDDNLRTYLSKFIDIAA